MLSCLMAVTEIHYRCFVGLSLHVCYHPIASLASPITICERNSFNFSLEIIPLITIFIF